MASEHEHNDWRYVRVEEAIPDYFYARCRICNVLARRKAETQTWELLEDKPTYRQLEQQLATLTSRLLPEHETLVKEVADMRLELEQIKCQKMLLSGRLQESEQQLATLRANNIRLAGENAALRLELALLREREEQTSDDK